MSSYKIVDANGQKAVIGIANHISKSLDLKPGKYNSKWILQRLNQEKQKLEREFKVWQKVVEKLDAVESVGYYRGPGLIKIFDVEKRIETDTDKARVNTYIIKGEEVEKLFRVHKKGQKVIIKFISPRTIEQLVSVWLFYEKALKLFDESINFINNCGEEVTIES